MTLLHPADGQVRVHGVTSCTNVVLHDWLKQQLSALLETLPAPTAENPLDEASIRRFWKGWQEGLTSKPTSLAHLPPVRMLLVLDNLAGHTTPEFVCWLFDNAIMPLYTQVGGSWLNMAKSIQRILKRRAIEGQDPTEPEQIIAAFAAVAAH